MPTKPKAKFSTTSKKLIEEGQLSKNVAPCNAKVKEAAADKVTLVPTLNAEAR